MKPQSTSRAAALVAAGILLSRVAGFVRVSVFADFFGQESDAADAFNAAFRIPNVLQNLFGEGALSASFIPVYAGLLAEGRERDADRAALTIFTLLSLVTSVLVLAGVLLAPEISALLAVGFSDAKRDLTTSLVRILFPGAGLLVISAWCLGVLNSHRKFFMSYTAPVLWNAAMIGTLVIFGPGRPLDRLAVILAIGSVVGSALQFLVQLPAVIAVFSHLPRVRPHPTPEVRTVVRNFVPALVSRGVVQVSAWIDGILASFLPTGAVAAISNAQVLYTLPVSLFGISISAAELPAMSSVTGGEEARRDALCARLNAALEQIAFFVIPSAAAFFAFGDVIAAGIFQHGRFRAEDAVYVWGILAGSAVGLVASTMARLYSAAYYSLGDTRTPLRFAIVRVTLVTVLGYLSAIVLPPAIGIASRWGAAGLTASAGVAGWCEFALLRLSLNRRVGPTGIRASRVAAIWTAAGLGVAAGWMMRMQLPIAQPQIRAGLILGPFGLIFLGAAYLLRVPIPSWRRR